MIVCHCHYVSDREIRQCAQTGACSVTEVGRACGAGTGCGGCRPEIANIVNESQQHSPSSIPGVGLLPVLRAS